MKSNLSQIKHWVFDLDHTLYDPKVKLFDQIEVLMNTYLKKTLNITQEKAIYLREEFNGINPGYHMNKKHWNTIDVNKDVPDDQIIQMIDDSYLLVIHSFPKKIQKELFSDLI